VTLIRRIGRTGTSKAAEVIANDTVFSRKCNELLVPHSAVEITAMEQHDS
jgi:hypothetical protein